MKMKSDNIQARIALNSMYGVQPKYPRGYGGTHVTAVIVERAKINLSKQFVQKMDDDMFRTSIAYLVSHTYENSYNFYKIIYNKLLTNECWRLVDVLYKIKEKNNGR